MPMTYFASDGNFGDAEDILIVDTSNWTAEDWQSIDDASDSRRADLAVEIAKRYN